MGGLLDGDRDIPLMPYRLSKDKKSVMVKRRGKWVVLKRHKGKAKALAHLRALKANVKE